MSIKRRDNKGRILNTGESQRRDGRYVYKYTDVFGKSRFLYSKRLNETDPIKGKYDKSLREKIKELEQSKLEGLDIKGKDITVCEWYKMCLAQKKNIRSTTKKNYTEFLKFLEKEPLGRKPIASISIYEAKQWVIDLETRFSYRTLQLYKTLLKQVFKSAIQNDYIRKNPFDFPLSSVISNNTEGRKALSKEEEDRLLRFIRNDTVYSKYIDEIIILINTGLRISEFCGLKCSDIDLQNKVIYVRHQLRKMKNQGYVISSPKSNAGIRDIPMTDEVYQAFQNVIRNRKAEQPISIEGHSGFVFLNSKGFPKVSSDYQLLLDRLIKKYNDTHEDKLPSISPHVFRHTFCTRLANKGMNPKSLQYIMGHSDIGITLNLYSHADFNTVQEEMRKIFK